MNGFRAADPIRWIRCGLLLLAIGSVASRGAVAAPVADSASTVTAQLAQNLSAHFNVTGELQLELQRPWSPPAAPWRLEVLEYPSALASSMIVRARIATSARESADVTFVVRANLWREAWAARVPLVTGGSVDPTTLDARRTDFLREHDVVPADEIDSGYVLARNVSAGRVLTWRDLARRPLVRKGDLVEVAATEGSLVITMKAVALESGARGDTIALRNPESRKNFSAQVINENRVQVRF